MSQDTDFVATGPSSVGFRTGPGQPLNIETSGLFEGKNVGVEGKADLGAGVSGNSVSDDGVVGTTSTVGKSGVFGFNTQSNGAAFGVSGSSGSPDGAGVNGFSGKGYGGNFSGGRASMRLIPANTSGRPTTGNHQRGEVLR